jgi:hypothetical protein
VHVDEWPLVFFHFQSLNLLTRSGAAVNRFWRRSTFSAATEPPLVWGSDYPIREEELRLVYEPYVEALSDALRLVRTVEPSFAPHRLSGIRLLHEELRSRVGGVARRARGRGHAFEAAV